MPQISTQEFERLPLRVHDFLAGVSLHDVWAVDLPRTRSGITLDEFVRTASGRLYTLSPVVRALLSMRFFVGRLLGWDRCPSGTNSGSGQSWFEPSRGNEARQRLSRCRASPICGVCELRFLHVLGGRTRAHNGRNFFNWKPPAKVPD